MPKNKHFSLVELLIVIAVLAILMSLLVPAINKMVEEAKHAKCVTNLKSLITGTSMYCDDNYDLYPSRRSGASLTEMKSGSHDLRNMLRPYFGGACGPQFVCPFYERRKFGLLDTGIEELPLPSSEVGYGKSGGHYRMTYNFFPNATSVYSGRRDRMTETIKTGSVNIGFGGDSNTLVGRKGEFETELMWSDRLVLSVKGWRVGAYFRPVVEGSTHVYSGALTGTHHTSALAELKKRNTHGYHSYSYYYYFSGKSNWGYSDGSVMSMDFFFSPNPNSKNNLLREREWGGYAEVDEGKGNMMPIFPNLR
jgi:competence protein ComGC